MKTILISVCTLLLFSGFAVSQANAASAWIDCSKINAAIIAFDIKEVKSILYNDPSVVSCNSNGLRPIFTAAKSGDVPTLKILVAYGADINDRSNESEGGVSNFIFPIHLASQFNNKDVVALLLGLGADVNALDQRGETALMRALSAKKFDNALELLDAGADPNIETKYGSREAVSLAVRKADLAFIAIMKAHGADFLTADKTGNAAIYDAIYVRSLDKLKLVVSYGADIEGDSYYRTSPLLVAVITRSLDCFTYLLEQGADPKKETEHGSTIVTYAAQSPPDPRFVEVAIDHGLPVSWVDNDGFPILHAFIAIAKNSLSSTNESTLTEFAKSMRRRGYNFLQFDPRGNLPSHYLSVRGTTLNLISAFEGPSHGGCSHTKSGMSLMHLLAESGGASASEIDVLLARGCSLSERDYKSGRTPLHFAALNLNTSMMKALLEKQVAVDRLDSDGYTPLHLLFTVEKRNEPMLINRIEVAAEILKTYGSDVNAFTSKGDTSFHVVAKRAVQYWNPSSIQPISAMLRLGMDINKPNKSGLTPLKLAKLLGAPGDFVDLLIRKGATE